MKSDGSWIKDPANEGVTLTFEKVKVTVKKLKADRNRTWDVSIYFVAGGIKPTSYQSSKPNVVSVDNTGKVTTKKKGTATISAVYGTGKNAVKYSLKIQVK